MFLTCHQAEICWFKCSWSTLFLQILLHDSKKWTARNKFTPVAEYLTTSFSTLNTTNRPLICWHTAPGHSWKQDVLLLLFKLIRFKSGSQLNFKNRCSIAKGLNWPQQWEVVSLELEYSLLAGWVIKDAWNWKQERPKVYYCLHSMTALGIWEGWASMTLGLGNKLMPGRFRCVGYEGG